MGKGGKRTLGGEQTVEDGPVEFDSHHIAHRCVELDGVGHIEIHAEEDEAPLEGDLFLEEIEKRHRLQRVEVDRPLLFRRRRCGEKAGVRGAVRIAVGDLEERVKTALGVGLQLASGEFYGVFGDLDLSW